jgi:hypothetical protein
MAKFEHLHPFVFTLQKEKDIPTRRVMYIIRKKIGDVYFNKKSTKKIAKLIKMKPRKLIA